MAQPTDSLRQTVLERMKAKLQAIAGNPLYFNTVKATSVTTEPDGNIMTLPPTEMPYFIIEPTPDGSKFYMPSMRLKHQFQVLITARDDAPSRNLKMQTWERLIADIEVALTRDITLGGAAVDVRVLEATPGFDLNPTTPTIIVVQPVMITLIRTYGQPWNS